MFYVPLLWISLTFNNRRKKINNVFLLFLFSIESIRIYLSKVSPFFAFHVQKFKSEYSRMPQFFLALNEFQDVVGYAGVESEYVGV